MSILLILQNESFCTLLLDLVYYFIKMRKKTMFLMVIMKVTMILKTHVEVCIFFPILGPKILKSSTRTAKLANSKRT